MLLPLLGMTPLASGGNATVVEAIGAAIEDTNSRKAAVSAQRESDGMSAIGLAVVGGHVDAVAALVAIGDDKVLTRSCTPAGLLLVG